MTEIHRVGQIAGTAVHEAILYGAGGIRVVLLTYGARLAQLWVPDAKGNVADIVLGQENLEDWQTHGIYVGATCGRYANRIAGGRFSLDGRTVQLDRNEGDNTLHGGSVGLDQKVWSIADHSGTHVTFATTSPDGDMGFPGTLTAHVTYRVDGTALEIEMTAVTDAPTVVNLVNHAYFNLAGQGSGDVMGHLLQVDADSYLPVDSQLIPTGEVRSVSGTPFDFRTPRLIGASLPGPAAFDHNLVLSALPSAEGLRPCLVASDPASGRQLRLSTSEPGVQLYTGAHFNGGPGKDGARYPRFAGFAVETQRFPDAPNRPHFPSARLDPGQTYRHVTRLDLAPGRPA